MTEFNWERIRKEKDAHRDRLAALPFAEKLKALERLRARTLAVGGRDSFAGRVHRAPASNAQISVIVATPAGTKARIPTASANAAFFGAAPTFAGAIAPSPLGVARTRKAPPPKRSR